MERAHARGPGARQGRRADRRDCPAVARDDHFCARSSLRRLERRHLRPSRQSDGAGSRSGDRSAGGRGGDARPRLGHVGRGRAVPGPGPQRACHRAAPHVLGAAQLARQRGSRSRAPRRFRRHGGPRGAHARHQARRDPSRLARDAEQSAVERERHRSFGPDRPLLSRSTRPAPPRSSPVRSRSAPISSCIRRRSISTAIPT